MKKNLCTKLVLLTDHFPFLSSHKRVDIQLQFQWTGEADTHLHNQPEQSAKCRSATVV